MPVLGDLLREELAEANNAKPLLNGMILSVEGISLQDQNIKLTVMVKVGHSKEVAKYLDPHIKRLIQACEEYNKMKKEEGDGTYETTMVSFHLGL